MLTFPKACWRWPRFRPWLAGLASKSRHSKSGEPRILHPRSRRSRQYVVGDALINANRTRIMTLSLTARLPTIFNARSFIEAGGLMSYGPNFSDQFRRTAELVDKILRGTKPGDIPVEQPSRFELVINLTTAEGLGLTIPESFLLRADEVIE